MTTDLPTLVHAYIQLGDGFPAMIGEGTLTVAQGEGWTSCRDVLRSIAEDAHGIDAFADEYKRQQGIGV